MCDVANPMRIVCISDTHGQTSALQIPDGDILIVAGDVCLSGSSFELELFNDFLGLLPHTHKLVIAGNHDWPFFFQTQEEIRALLNNAIYLEDSGIEINGVNFYGSPWQPDFHNWAYNLPRGEPLAQMWEMIPDDTDVLITHGPPYGILDRVYSGDHVGCEDLLAALPRVMPKLHVFGHIHEDYGVLTQNGTVFVNAAICDGQYRPVNDPIVIDL